MASSFMMKLPSLLALLLAIAACHGGEVEPISGVALKRCRQGDLTSESMYRAEVVSDGVRVWNCRISSDGTIRLAFEAAPGGTLAIDELTYDVPPDGWIEVPIDLDPEFLAVKLSRLAVSDPPQPKRTVAVELVPASGPPVHTKLQIVAALSAKQRIMDLVAEGGAGRPLALSGVARRTPIRGTVVYASRTEHGTYLTPVGPDVTLTEVELIAVAVDLDRRPAGTCGPYAGGGMVASADREKVDIRVVVYEAATGAQIADRTFKSGHSGCPPTMGIAPGHTARVVSRPEARLVTRWLTKLAKARS